MRIIELNNHVRMPALGIGTFQLSPEEAYQSVLEALKVGFRLIDTANAYVNERAVGRAIKDSGVSRGEVFISTKIWPTEYENPNAVEETLERLGVDYIDLLFLHQPVGNWKEGYKMLEKALVEGKIKAIGVSNFEGQFLEDLYKVCKVKPQVIQVEAHPFFWNKEVRREAAIKDLAFMSWFPLGHGDPALLENETVKKIAEAHKKSPAQIILRWHIQCGMIVIPGSKNKEHIKEDFELFDFELNDKEMYDMAYLHKDKRYHEITADSLLKYLTTPLTYEEK